MEKANTQLQTGVLKNSNSMQQGRKLLRDIMAIRDSSQSLHITAAPLPGLQDSLSGTQSSLASIKI